MRKLISRILLFINFHYHAGIFNLLISIFYRIISYEAFWNFFFIKRRSGTKLIKFQKYYNGHVSDEKVSIILPVNNGLKNGVQNLIKSLKSQTHTNLEFIAVDSGSTDDTPEYLRENGFRVIQINPSDFSHAFSRNTGASEATGQYLLFVVDDVVFENPEWISIAIAALNFFKADSFSSRQYTDNLADPYAQVLNNWLYKAQSNFSAVNVTRNNFLLKSIRKIMPMHSQFRSMSIDDTNHLVRKTVFDKLLFKSETVEDLEFGLRLVRSGGKVVYTNLIGVKHYHNYNIVNITKYARRVYLDNLVFKKWRSLLPSLASRDSHLYNAKLILSLGFDFFMHEQPIKLKNISAQNINSQIINTFNKEGFNTSTVFASFESYMHDHINSRNLKNYDHFKLKFVDEEVNKVYESIFESPPPSSIYFDYSITVTFGKRLFFAFTNGMDSAEEQGYNFESKEEMLHMFIFHWINLIMFDLSHIKFKNKFQNNISCDNWTLSDWK